MEFVWKDYKKNNDSRWDQHEYPLSHKLTPVRDRPWGRYVFAPQVRQIAPQIATDGFFMFW